jgi:acetyl-CoA C-acetyltransferase
MKKEVYIISAVRTAIGSIGGSLSSVEATKLGAAAIDGALKKGNVNASDIDEVYMGMVLQANAGQAPARQSAKFAGIPDNVPCTTINKVCASGMKTVMLATQSILLGDSNSAIAGGMESMSNAPFMLEGARSGYKFGHQKVNDCIVKDGLTDVYSQSAMGVSAELCAKTYDITREQQDTYAIESYKRSAEAWSAGKFNEEVVPVAVPSKKETIMVAHDEEYKAVKFDKIPELKPVFAKDGTVTAANASTLNDGAAALVLMSKEKAESLGLKPIAKVIAYADAEQAPEWFTTTPSKAIPLAIEKANIKQSDVDYYEINEAFSAVALANMQLLNITADKINVNGGAVALGHPLGCSGARIIVTLINVLKQNNAKYGVAGICNGGGGASAIVIENVQ